jgi:hypothetical protein
MVLLVIFGQRYADVSAARDSSVAKRFVRAHRSRIRANAGRDHSICALDSRN